MYTRKITIKPTRINTFAENSNDITKGETLEQMLQRIMNNNEPIKHTVPLQYFEREKGVVPATNIRTDRFEHAIETMDKVVATAVAKRKDRAEKAKIVAMNKQDSDSNNNINNTSNNTGNSGGAGPLQAT